MAINLQKGQTIDLRKNDKGEIFDLSSVTIGLGWDVKAQKKPGLLGQLLGGAKEEDYDLDAIAFLLDKNGKVANLGRIVQSQGMQIPFFESDIIYFNNQKHASGHIWLTGDNRTGAGEGDDEQIIAKLDSMNPQVDRIVFLVTIYQGRNRQQHFGMINNAYIRAVDNKGREIARYELSSDSSFSNMHSLVFAELYRKDGTWKFRALGQPGETDSFIDILKNYIYA